MSKYVDGFVIPIPNFIYGTAWKEERTQDCVFKALSAGFRAIDTANQRKHYYEEGVGKGLLQAYSELKIKRVDLFLQTKFTFARGQDHRKPYNENDPYSVQVRASFESSLKHLHTDYVDSYVLHGPSTGGKLTEADLQTWQEMEKICEEGKTKYLGVSNVSLEQLKQFFKLAKIKPTFVQNRCYAETGWDYHIRKFCLENEIFYQGFSLLTANGQFLGRDKHPQVTAILQETKKNMEQVVFRFSQMVGMIPLTGTSDLAHMQSDLDINDFDLNKSQLETMQNIAFLA